MRSATSAATLNSSGGDRPRVQLRDRPRLELPARTGSTGTTDGRTQTRDFVPGLRHRVTAVVGPWCRSDVGVGRQGRRAETCSFPSDEGGMRTGERRAGEPGCRRRSRRANVASTPAMVGAWIAGLQAAGDDAVHRHGQRTGAVGHNHYDVHPSCTTYEEVLDRYVAYADAIRSVDTDAELLGPVSCCWFDYWRTAPGPTDGHEDYLYWFLDHVRQPTRLRSRSIDVLDVHYYPQGDVYNEADRGRTAARRLRSTRSLWDTSYIDESWIDQTIEFIPRMRARSTSVPRAPAWRSPSGTSGPTRR